MGSDGLAEADGERLGETEGEIDGDSLALGDIDVEGDMLGLTDALGEMDAEGLTLADGDIEAEGETEELSTAARKSTIKYAAVILPASVKTASTPPTSTPFMPPIVQARLVSGSVARINPNV